jgi:hypothetical protein
MTRSRIAWTVALLLAAGALIGFSITANMIRTEGFAGVWNRKKKAVETLLPGSEPVLERGERVVRESASNLAGDKD